ncbi:MAG: PTS fructose transporter subunit IIA [Clostridiales Family XIII bacterium]|jgi:mannose/fructose-specific phosphotransferase system component IIA|nr:PTS fructose transporter subunit IIA [Clostridiales Family XIII bacterium]
MRSYLIATHGKLASGFNDAIKMLIGEDEHVTTIDAYVNDEDTLVEDLQAWVDSIADADQAVIFTDLEIGSVNQKILTLIYDMPHVFLLTGANLPVILDIMLIEDSLTEEIIQDSIRQARESITISKLDGSAGNATDDEFLS